MNRYFDCAELSDITIRFGSDIIRGHKIVLAQGSTWFSRAFEGGFQEAATAELQLLEDDPMAVKGMLAHFYGPRYDPNGPQLRPYTASRRDEPFRIWDQIEPMSYLLYLVDLWVVADKYDVICLKDGIVSALSDNLPNFYTAEMRPEFEWVARKVYETDDSDSATVVKRGICCIIAHRFRSASPEWRVLFEQLMRDIPALAVDVVSRLTGSAPMCRCMG